MDSDFADSQLSSVAGAIADPARARMLCLLLDGRARHRAGRGRRDRRVHGQQHFQRLRDQGLVEQAAQGKHRYYRLANGEVARALEALLVVAGAERTPFKPSTPSAARGAHLLRPHGRHPGGAHARRDAGAPVAGGRRQDYALTPLGEASLAQIGVDAVEARRRRRRFACPCLDWSERRPHLGGALGRPCWTR